ASTPSPASEGGMDKEERSLAAFPLTVLDRMWPETLLAGNLLIVGPPDGALFRPQEVRPRDGHPLLRHVDWSEVHVAAARRVPLTGAGPLPRRASGRGRRAGKHPDRGGLSPAGGGPGGTLPRAARRGRRPAASRAGCAGLVALARRRRAPRLPRGMVDRCPWA